MGTSGLYHLVKLGRISSYYLKGFVPGRVLYITCPYLVKLRSEWKVKVSRLKALGVESINIRSHVFRPLYGTTVSSRHPYIYP